MTKIEKQYLQLLQRALWNRLTPDRLTPDPSLIERGVERDVRIEEVAQLAMRQGTGPLVMDQLLKTLPQGDGVREEMKQVCMQNMLRQEQMRVVMEKTLAALAEGGVEATMFKGFALAQLYPQPHLRQWGDIDIYVGDKGYHQAAEILRKTWPNCPCFETEEDYFKHWNIIADGVSIEAHRVSLAMTHPGDKKIWMELEEKGLTPGPSLAEKGEREWFNVLLVFIHSWHHYTESRSANMKQLCDVAMCVKHLLDSSVGFPQDPSVGFPHRATVYLKKNLRRLRLTEVWEAYAWIMVNYLGLPVAQCPLYTPQAQKRGERLLENILHPERKYSKPSTSVSKNILVRKMRTLKIKLAASLSLWEIAPRYAVHDMAGKVMDGMGRMMRGEWNRRWE